MSIVASADQAEEVVKAWLERKFDKSLRKTRVTQISLSGGVWDVKAEVELRNDPFSTKRQNIMIKVDSETANVVSYSENEIPRPPGSD